MSGSSSKFIHATVPIRDNVTCDDREIAADCSRKQHFCVQVVHGMTLLQSNYTQN